MTESGPFSPSRGLRVRGRSRCCWCERGPRAQSGSGLLPLGAHRRLWDQPAPVTSMWTRGVSFCTTSPAPHGPHGHFHRVRTGTSPGNGSETARPQPQAGLSVRLLKAPERACASSWGTCLLPPPPLSLPPSLLFLLPSPSPSPPSSFLLRSTCVSESRLWTNTCQAAPSWGSGRRRVLVKGKGLMVPVTAVGGSLRGGFIPGPAAGAAGLPSITTRKSGN